MTKHEITRRSFLTSVSLGVALGATSTLSALDSSASSSSTLDASKVKFCLNLGTLRNYELSLMDELKTARDAGYHSVEIWFDRLQAYSGVENGHMSRGKLEELKKFLDGEGLQVEGAIGFATWIMNEPERRKQGLDELACQMEALEILGAPYVAAPAAGPWNEKISDLDVIAERYRAILELGETYGVRPLLELWGPSPTLSQLSDCLAICAKTGRTDAALLLDVYHLYRGGNPFEALALISGAAMPVFHMNDYPSEPEREKLNDGDRVFPGDGAAPMDFILSTILNNGFNGVLSFEIFNRSYRDKMSAVDQARIGLEKMQSFFAPRG
ncbi:MAG: sugar phosphate isomerase/epimerase family protein [Planctomycetia bacterium]|nr:sugar phosphate isomerase/epimerase family protein [Planctomycetia bacterium]